MNRSSRTIFSAVCPALFAALLLGQGAGKPAQPAAPAAKQPLRKPLFENERVRVIEVVWEPGAASEAFKGFPTSESLGVVAVVLKGGTVEHRYPGGKNVRKERRPGEVFWQAPGVAVEARQNAGNTRLDMVQAALKKAPPTKQYTGPVAGEKKLLDNARVAAFEITLAPGAKIAMHKYAPRVWVILQGGDMRSFDSAGKPQEARFGNSQVVWLPAQGHSLENIGKTEERIVSIELK